MDCSLPGPSVHGISQARILEWVAMPSSRGSSQPKARTSIACVARQILHHWATWEAQRGKFVKLMKEYKWSYCRFQFLIVGGFKNYTHNHQQPETIDFPVRLKIMRALSRCILTNSINMWITYESKEHKINPNCLDHSHPCHRWLGIVPLQALSNPECQNAYCDLSDYGIWSVERFLEGFFSFLISLGSPNLNITVPSSKSSQQKYFLFSTVGCDACWGELWVLSTRLRFLSPDFHWSVDCSLVLLELSGQALPFPRKTIIYE